MSSPKYIWAHYIAWPLFSPFLGAALCVALFQLCQMLWKDVQNFYHQRHTKIINLVFSDYYLVYYFSNKGTFNLKITLSTMIFVNYDDFVLLKK